MCQWLSETLSFASRSFDAGFDHGIMALACVAARLASRFAFQQSVPEESYGPVLLVD